MVRLPRFKLTMRVPLPLQPLLDYGIIDGVVRPLMSGKEAQIYLVHTAGFQRVAKLYKEASQRSFQKRSDYTEGRSTRNSRDRRAMHKHSRHGRAQDEEAWRRAEVDIIYTLQQAGVRVPEPFNYSDGVLVMEMITDADGNPAPRLGDAELTASEAQDIFDELLGGVVRMLCAGIVHGDLSEFNVLLSGTGPVIIDFPQAVDAASNLSARKLLLRDVDNLNRFLARYVSGGRKSYGEEMWELYTENRLTPDTKLVGRGPRQASAKTDTREVLDLVRSDERDAQRGGRRRGRGRGNGNGNGNAPGRHSATRGGPVVEVAVKGAGGRWTTTSSEGPGSPASRRPESRLSDGGAKQIAAKRSPPRPPATATAGPGQEQTRGEGEAPKRNRRPRRRGRRP